MKIYHGSLEVVEHPLILPPQRTLDYGQGFYTTTSERQSKEWVERRMHEKHTSCGYVNIYKYEAGAISVETLIRELKTYKLVEQYLFHTNKALTALHFVEATKIG